MREIRLTVRSLARTPLYTLTAILSLALGIGATTAIFSMMDRVLLRNAARERAGSAGVPLSSRAGAGQLVDERAGRPGVQLPDVSRDAGAADGVHRARRLVHGRRQRRLQQHRGERARPAGLRQLFPGPWRRLRDGARIRRERRSRRRRTSARRAVACLLDVAVRRRSRHAQSDDDRQRPRVDRRRCGAKGLLRRNAGHSPGLVHSDQHEKGDDAGLGRAEGSQGLLGDAVRPPQAGEHARTGADRDQHHVSAAAAAGHCAVVESQRR